MYGDSARAARRHLRPVFVHEYYVSSSQLLLAELEFLPDSVLYP